MVCLIRFLVNPMLTVLLEKLISPKAYFMPEDKIRELRHKAIIEAHKYHYGNNKYYREYCESKGIGLSITPSDFPKLLIPDSVFKSYPMDFPEQDIPAFAKWLQYISSVSIPQDLPSSTGTLEEMLNEFYKRDILLGFSSGTSGRMTFLPRDKQTRENLVKSYVSTVDAHVKLDKGNTYFVLSIPEESYLQIAWNGKNVSNALSPGKAYFAMKHLKADFIRIRTGKLKNFKERVIKGLSNLLAPRIQKKAEELTIKYLRQLKDKKLVFLAPPYMIASVARKIIERGIDAKLHPESIITSTGGFKGRTPIEQEEMYRLIKEAFGLDKHRYPDLYGMTESNSIAMECLEGLHKHFPPWIEPILLDENMEPIEPDGKVTGQYGFLEPSILSYPGFILTGDRLTVNWDGCDACNRNTPIIEKIERMPTVEGRGCSGVLARTVGAQI